VAPLGKRVSTQRIDKIFHYPNRALSEDSEFVGEKKSKKRVKKA
jgi:hypothetical protein